MCHLVTTLVVLTLAVAQAQDGGKSKTLSLSVKPDKTELAVYEPLYLTVALRNAGAAPLEVPASVLNNLEFYRKEKGKDWELVGYGSRRGWDALGARVLAPGEAEFSEDVLLLRRLKADERFVFGRPGTYELKARLPMSGGPVLDSAAVKVEVRRPNGDDPTAAELFARGVLMESWGHREASAAGLKELAATYARTVYADHANLALGEYHYSQYAGSRDQFRGADESKAVAAYRRYAAVSPRLVALRARALLPQANLAVDSAEVRRLADLPKLVAEIEASFPVTDAMQIGSALRKRHAELKRLLPSAGSKNP